MRKLLAVVQRVAGEIEDSHGAAAVLTNLGTYQDSKHLHVHVHSGLSCRDRGESPSGLGVLPSSLHDIMSVIGDMDRQG